MSDNLAYQEDWRTETHNGEIVYMSPRPAIKHNRVAGNIYRAFGNHLEGKTCDAFADGTDVHLTEKDCVVPDVMIVCNHDIIKDNAIYGAPDLIVEVLSPGTEKRDRGYKKNLYECCGVREYWIVDPVSLSVEVYLLENGKYELDEVYRIFPDYTEFYPNEKECYKNEVPVSLYDDFSIPLTKIFYRVI